MMPEDMIERLDWIVTLGLIACGMLALIPIAMIGKLVSSMVRESRRIRAAEARRVTAIVPGLGEFSSTDNELWGGQVSGVQVWLRTLGQPPTESQARQVLAILDDFPELVAKSCSYLVLHEDCSWLEGGAAEFKPYAIVPENEVSFVLELVHPADLDGVYCVTFRDGEPVDSARDD